MPGSATKALLISRPSSVRIGIDWRFGFVVERRPVEATCWLKVVCRRPSCCEIRPGQRPEIRVEELRVLAPLLDDAHELVLAADGAEHAGVRRVAGLALAAGCELELLEEDARHLLRGAEHELLAGKLVRPRFQLLDAIREPRGDLPHAVRVDPDSGVLHRREDLGERELDGAVQRVEAALGDPRPQERSELVDGGAVADERRGLLVGRRLGHELDAVLGSEVVEWIVRAPGLDQVGHQERVVDDVQAPRLGVVGDERGVAEAGSVLRRPRADEQLLAFACEREAAVLERQGRFSSHLRQLPLAPRHVDALDLDRRGRERLVDHVHALEQVPELEPPEDLLQLRAVGWGEHEAGGIDVELEVAAHRGELLRVACLLGMLAQRLRATRRELVHVLEHALERAVLRHELAAVLSPIPGTPGMLSEVSPFRPMKSGTCSGVTP